MTKSVIKEIIENFAQQLILYKDMAALSAAQLASLENNQLYDDVNKILMQRAQLMQSISSLNEKNRYLQEQALQELGIEEFILTQLQVCLESEEMFGLQSAINGLSSILKTINEMDSRTQVLMAERKIGMTSKKIPGNPEAARQAYQQSSQNKSNKTKNNQK